MGRRAWACGAALCWVVAAHGPLQAQEVTKEASVERAFDRARKHFVAAMPPKAQRGVTPTAPDQAPADTLGVGGLWPFDASGGKGRRVRGFASAEGEVVLWERPESLGVLAKACGLLEAAPACDPLGAAERFAWVYVGLGPLYRKKGDFSTHRNPEVAPPALEVSADGVALRFYVVLAGDTGTSEVQQVSVVVPRSGGYGKTEVSVSGL
jgi:hypothetical protein